MTFIHLTQKQIHKEKLICSLININTRFIHNHKYRSVITQLSKKHSPIYTWLHTYHYKFECIMIVSICNLSRNKHLHTIIANIITYLNTITTIHYQ